MAWQFATTTTQVARKQYRCDAADVIGNAGLDAFDFNPQEREVIEKAKAEKWQILPRTAYVKTSGKWEGEFSTFRARADLDQICVAHHLYEE